MSISHFTLDMPAPGTVWSIYEYITFYIGYACSRFANQLFRTQTSGITHSSHTCIPHRQRNI